MLTHGAMALFIAGTFYACQKKQLSAETADTATDKGSLKTNVSTGLIVGINGHPLNTIEYNANGSTIAAINYQTQANMVKAMGMSYYRIDVSTSADGTAANEAKMLDIVAKCAANNIKVLPMIYDRCNYTASGTTNYNNAFAQMAGFATKYGQYFDYFELGNEWELFDDFYVTKPAPHQGKDSTDYIMAKVRSAEQYVKGMEAGLKSVLPNKKTMVNTAGFLPTFWMDRMLAAAPTINILGWHWYADMPGAVGAPQSIHDFLWNRYHKPIWYTETGYKSKKSNTQQQNEDGSNNWRITFTNEALANPHVEAIIFFQLLDLPERTHSTTSYSYAEETLGWVKFNGYPGKDDPAAYNAWLADPNRYQNWSYKKPAAELVGPDLVVTDITWVPASPHAGDNVVFTATVKNVGAAATPAGTIVGVNFKVDGNSAGCNGSSTASLAPGATLTLTANGCSPSSWTAVAGSHSVVANVDDQLRIRESNETNNTLTKTITVN